MATVQQIGRSISVAEDLGGVVGTMKGLAAVSVRQYERARESAQDYIDTLELGLQIVVRHNLELPKPRALGRPVGIIIFGTEQGLCGPLNRHILEYAGGWIADEGIGRKDRRILAVGTRLGEEIRGFSLDAEALLPHPSSVAGTTERIEDILLRIDEWLAGGVTDIVAIYHSRAAQTRAQPVRSTIHPLEASLLHEIAARPWETNMLPSVAGSPTDVFATLSRQLIVARLFIAFADALASEHGERLIAMQGAESNIDQRLEDLQSEYRRERQTAITSELLDLISGYEMVSGPSGTRR
jgi:F-type H+-transporting ATPase subunit gamma